MNATIKGYMDACLESESEVEEILLKITAVRRELIKLDSDLVGAKERAKAAKEVLRLAASQEVIEYVTPREREIAHMKGLTLNVGDPLSLEEKQELFRTPALEQFTRW